MTKVSDNLHFFYDAQNRPAVVVYNGTAYAYVKNLQGDIIAILNNAGTAVVTYTYDAWGNPTSTTGTMEDTLGKLNPFRYRGYVFDEETGLYYLRSRFFNPLMIRFINTDAIIGRVRINRHNLYAYCDNKPGKYIDTQGTEPYDMFDSELEAVINFSECYNDEAIEYAAMIYEDEGQFFYAEPQVGTDHNVESFNLNPNIPIAGTPVSFVHTHTNDRRRLRAFWPSDEDITTLCVSSYSHAYLIVPDNSVIKMSKASNAPTITEDSSADDYMETLLDVKVCAISGGVKKATNGNEMNWMDFQETVSNAYSTRVNYLWWAPILWSLW